MRQEFMPSMEYKEQTVSRYNIFQAIFMSFYSRNLYKDVGQNWGGKTFLYLFILLALSWIGDTIQIQSGLSRMYARTSNAFVAQIPVMTIKQGILSTPEKKPYIIKEPGTENLFAIIDTSGKYTDISNTKADILVTQNKIFNRQDEHETRIHALPTTFSAVINPEVINGYVKSGINYAWIFIFTFLLILSFIYRILQSLLYAILGKIFSAISKSNVSYGSIVQITMVAITPAIVLSTLCNLVMFDFPHEYLTYFVISMLYMIYGIRANKS